MSLDQDLDAGAEAPPAPTRAVADPSPHHLPGESDLRWGGSLGLEPVDDEGLRHAAWVDEDGVALRLELEEVAALGPLDDLLVPDLLVHEPDPGAVELVRRFFAELGGRGILVEPPGPGARSVVPMVLGELVARGLADRVLVAAAPGTGERVAADVATHLGLDLRVARTSDDPALDAPRVVLDHDLAEAEVERLEARRWDLIVVDAAHQVAGDDASHVRRALARLLTGARWVMLVTPAPARDDLLEVRRLAELVRPGTFRPDAEFRSRLVDPDVRCSPSRPAELAQLLVPALVGMPASARPAPLRPRAVEHHEVELTTAERAVVVSAAEVVGRLVGPDGWDARRLLVPAMADPGPHLAAAAVAAAAVAPDDALRDGLLDLATAADGLDEDGPRLRLLVTLVRLWQAEHGRVLVVAGSVGASRAAHARLVAAGLEARLLHEGQPATGRLASLGAWSDGTDVVLVADDAALRSVELEPASCVVCADLPWDPVVLDDRVAAVGSYGEDEVVVATFVATGSADATVAEVLTGHVELFGHGTGWARTLLAELDPAVGPVPGHEAPIAFVDRLVVALAADPAEVASALEDLADDLEAARRRTRLLHDAALRNEVWTEAPAPTATNVPEHDDVAIEGAAIGDGADGVDGPGALEEEALDDDGFFVPATPAEQGPTTSVAPAQPHRVAHPRASALRDVFARWATSRPGGRVLRHEPGLLVTEGVLDASPGRWVFDRAGAASHPGARLVAPGSPALAELLGVVRAEVPLRATVAEPVDLPVVDAADHVPSVSLVDRLVEPPSTWSTTSTWRVRSGATLEQLVEVAAGESPAGRSARRPLDPGEPLPSELPDASRLVEQVEAATRSALSAAASATAEGARASADADRARRMVHHHAAVDAARAVIEETVAGSPEHERATERLRELHAEHPADAPALAEELDGRVRATLVALQVDVGDDFVVVERWRHEHGAEAEVRYPWAADGACERRSEVSGDAVAVLALCEHGHVVDADELVWCPGCERHGCAACGPDRALAPCPTCETEVCGECRAAEQAAHPTGSSGPCRQCRSPQREVEADGEWALAWRLGGAALLLVGARWAELRTSPDAEPLILVPDEDVEDPVRRRLRTAADALGLPLDAGAAALERGPRPLPTPTDAWMATFAGASWKVELGRGAEVLVDLVDFDGPDGPEPLVGAEAEHGLGALLARLRGEEEPPAPPAFVRTPHLDVERVAVVPGGLVRTVERIGADGSVEHLEDEQVDLLGEPGAAGHLFRPVASAALGGVELALTRLHRSTVVRLTTPTGTTECFVGAEPERTFGGELAWASWIEDEGLVDGAVLTVDAERPVLADDELAAPIGPDLERRAVVDVWGAVPADDLEDAPDLVGATDDDLLLVGYEEVPDLLLPAPDEARQELAEALHRRGRELDLAAPVVHRLEHRWFEVEETWTGRSTVRLAYKVSPGEPPWPRLDDTHQRAPDFEVDDHGHLHEPGTGWQCLACGEHHCRACGPVGAMDACGRCAQSACGLCRARAPREVPDQACDRCGARSCGDCGRVPDTVPCERCRRSICVRCRDDETSDAPRCGACARLRPALEEEVDALPSLLAAHGLHVELGRQDGETSVLLRGSWRNEVAVLIGGEVAWWVQHDGEDVATRRLLLAAARRWDLDGDLQVVSTGWTTRPAVVGPGLLLVAEETPEVRWTLEVDGVALDGSATPPRLAGGPDADGAHGELEVLDPDVAEALTRAVQAPRSGPVAALEPAERVPVPAPPVPPAGEGVTASSDDLEDLDDQAGVLEPGGRLVVEDRRRATATWLTPDGLQRLVSEGDDDRRTSAPWQVGVRFSWMTDGWEPEPEVVAYALLGEFEAAVVRVGRHLMLGVRGDERVVWWTLRAVPGDLRRTLLGDHLTGEERLLDLRVVTDPGKVQGPTVRDATFIGRRIEPVLEEVGTDDGDPDEALRAAAAWVRRTAASPMPTGPELDDDLVAALVLRADELSPPVLETVGIALQVEETWRQGLDEFPVPYRLAPGTTVGAVVCADAAAPSSVVHHDRSGHLAAEVVACPTCSEVSCRACHVQVQPCAVCADAVCGSCALEDGRCPVCATLVLVERKQAKHLGLKVSRRAVVLRAQVGARTVLAVRDDGAWAVTVEEAGLAAAPPPDDGRAALLEQIVLAPPPVPPPPPPPPPAPPPGEATTTPAPPSEGAAVPARPSPHPSADG